MIISTLKKKLGNKVKTSPDFLSVYSFDASRKLKFPIAVVIPENEEDILNTLIVCSRYGIPVTPRGGGSGLVGGAVPEDGGIVLSSEKLRDIKILDDGYAICQAGAITYNISRLAEQRGFFFPSQPSSSKFSTIGGNVATDSAGLHSAKYGSTKDYIISLRFATPAGAIVETGEEKILNDIISGSEGTLCFITAVKLKLLKLPKKKKTKLFIFNNVENLSEFSRRITESFLPSAFEVIDPISGALFGAEKAFYVILEDDSDYADEVMLNIDRLSKEVKGQAIEESPEKIWEKRKRIGPSLSKIRNFKYNEDVVFPLSVLEDFINGINNISEKSKLPIACFGHLGIGIMHTNILWNRGEDKSAEEARRILFNFILEIGGSITGEHGVGLSKREFLEAEISKETANLLEGIKSVFDPSGIMNPSKIFLTKRRGCIDTNYLIV